MLRLDVDSGLPATAPASNPFVGNASVLDEIWAIGLRNAWQFSFDRETGDMWIGDVGQSGASGREEINFQPASSTGGENYGWKIRQGFNSYQTGSCPGSGLASFSPTRTDPVRVLNTSSNNSIIGGYRYRGCAMPGRHGLYVYGNYGGGRIYTFEWNGSSAFNFVDRTSALGNGSLLYAFGEDYDGEILICHGSQVSRIVPDGILNNQDAGPGSVGSNGLTPIYEVCGTLGVGNTATFRTRNAPPNAAGSVLFGVASNPIPLPIPGFGTLVPGIVAFTIPYSSDADGIATWSIDGGTWPFNFFHQAAFLDAGITGVTLSNAFQTNFSSIAPPNITSVSPLSAPVGQTITINGADFAPAATVDVGGSSVTPISVNPSSITFAMPASVACDSSVTVQNPDGQNDSTAFNPTPTITGTFLAGPQLVITGTGFATTGTVVTVNATPLTLNSVSPTFISAVIPGGATNGDPLVITTPGGCVVNGTYP